MRMSRRAGLLSSGAMNLTGTTWIIRPAPTIPAVYNNPTLYYINFYDEYNTSISSQHTNINFTSDSNDPTNCIYYMGYDRAMIYYYYSYDGSTWWKNDGCRTIHITGGTDVTNPDLITWLQTNATLSS